jgi:hypothetical protein
VKRHTSKSHAAEFVTALSANGKNALRVILLHQSGAQELREALGINAAKPLAHSDKCTGHARRGTTIELFRAHIHTTTTNIRERH